MSGPHRAFSFDRGDDDEVLHSRNTHNVSPIHPSVDETPELAHSHPSPYTPSSPVDGPPPPQNWPLGPSQSCRTGATPGMDNMGPGAVGGGISGIALGIANSHDRLSGIHARQSLDNDGYIGPVERGYTTTGSDNPYVPPPPQGQGYASSDSLQAAARDSYGSNMALGAAGASSAGVGHSDPSQHSLLNNQPSPYQSGLVMNDGPFQRNSAYNGNGGYTFNPDEIADDGDDGLVSPMHGRRSQPAMTAAAGGAGGGVLGTMGGLVRGNQPVNPSYGPVPGGRALEAGEKSRWMKPRPEKGSRKRGWIVGLGLAFIVIGAIVGGAVGGILGNRAGDKDKTNVSVVKSAKEDKKTNGDLDKDSHEIKGLMGNKDPHKVFPAMDYTPWGVQYPLCLKYPPSQNNVTRDMAVLSQLTNTVRLYGTDCNQTEMVLHAIDQLELKDMKLWLGVWIDTNQTSNSRQLKNLYKILDDTKDTSIFKGAIVGNEALFRAGSDKQSAQKNIINYMEDVRKEFKKRSLDMPVATSDLGDNWNKQLAEESDAVMSNIHPFFAGVPVDQAASWSWTFWTTHDASLTKGTKKKQIISEIGWPSGGGNDCGSNVKCQSKTDGSVAGVDEMNQFMSDWVCQALENGTDYFWYVLFQDLVNSNANESYRFEAFDEPWKVEFNEPGREWEDKWGLMDAGRKLKPGIKIPDCNGTTAS